MKDNVFIDSNIWLYSFIEDAEGKYRIAAGLIQENKEKIAISLQVVNEVCINLIKKADFKEEQIEELINSFYEDYTIIDQDKDVLTNASKLRKVLSLSFWDSLIVSTAMKGECDILFSEDMQHNQVIENKLKILNPFK